MMAGGCVAILCVCVCVCVRARARAFILEVNAVDNDGTGVKRHENDESGNVAA